MGDFIVGGKWYLLGGWVANPKGLEPEIYKKSGLKTKKLFQNLFQRWCLISTFNCFAFAILSLPPLQEAALLSCCAQCFGRASPLPGGTCWVHELPGDHGQVRPSAPEVTAPHAELGWHLGCGHLDCASHSQTNHSTVLWGGVALTWSSLCGTRLPEFVFGSIFAGHDQQPSHLGWWQLSQWCPRGSPWGPGTAGLWWHPQEFTLMGAILCIPKYQRGWENLGDYRAESRSGSCAAWEYGCMYNVAFREQIQVGQFTL